MSSELLEKRNLYEKNTVFFAHAAAQSAIDACKSLATSSACSVSTPRGTVEGVCRQPPREKQTVCVLSKKRQQPEKRSNWEK